MKRSFKLFVLVICAVFVLFLGCSEQAEMPTVPAEGKMAVLSLASGEGDCSGWTFEELEAYAEEKMAELNCCCGEFNELLRKDKCFKTWFAQKLARDIKAGIAVLVSEKTYSADEHTKGPNCGIVDLGNDRCFNGDFEAVNTWVDLIFENDNEKQIINMANHNPCFRWWMWEMGILNEDNYTNKIQNTVITATKYDAGHCPDKVCTGGCTTIKKEYVDEYGGRVTVFYVKDCIIL